VAREERVSARFGDYVYDVFVSYRRGDEAANPMLPWIREVVSRLTFWLGQELRGRDAHVFFDTENLEVGSHWPDRLRHAILRSRCLVPILSPQYFTSRWCLTEWASFIQRQQIEDASGTVLIIPMKFHDGELFPQEARDITTLDLTRHAGTTRAFWSTVRADELDQMIQRFARDVAQAVEHAPPFDSTWTVHHTEPDGPKDFPMSRL
jgi:hypothetical protein